MADEFKVVWENRNAEEFLLNAANLSKISPSLLYLGKQFISPVMANKQTLKLLGGTTIKIVVNGEHKLYRIEDDIIFKPVECLDEGDTLEAGKDYHIYLLANSDTKASIVVSKNATYPYGAELSNSRRIGGFHTLCADVGETVDIIHNLYGFLAGDILPYSVWDLLNRPATCEPQGMVQDPKTKTWVDIYLLSGELVIQSAFNGSVLFAKSFDELQEALARNGKRMLTDAEFTSAALGTIPYKAVDKSDLDISTTGGNVNTDGGRVISDIGCEDMCGYFWQMIGSQSCTDYAVANVTTYEWLEANPEGEGHQLLPSNILVAGGSIIHAMHAGARSRHTANSRNIAGTSISTRGAANSLFIF